MCIFNVIFQEFIVDDFKHLFLEFKKMYFNIHFSTKLYHTFMIII